MAVVTVHSLITRDNVNMFFSYHLVLYSFLVLYFTVVRHYWVIPEKIHTPRRMAFRKISREGGFKGLGNPDGRGGETLNPRLRGFILSDRCSMTSMCFDHFNVLILFSNCIILRTVQCLPHFCKFPSTGSICNFIIEKKN